MEPSTRKTVDDFNASLDQLRVCIAAYHAGTKSVYRGVATELRKLLCDENKGKSNALIPRVFKNLRPHKLPITAMVEECPSLLEGLVFTTPVATEYDGKGGHRSCLVFATPLEKMDLTAWLDQPFISKTATIREFIRSVADKEAAHSDPNYNETLALSHSIHYTADRSTEDNMVALGEYVLAYLEREDMESNIPGLQRMQRPSPPTA